MMASPYPNTGRPSTRKVPDTTPGTDTTSSIVAETSRRSAGISNRSVSTASTMAIAGLRLWYTDGLPGWPGWIVLTAAVGALSGLLPAPYVDPAGYTGWSPPAYAGGSPTGPEYAVADGA